MRFRAISCVLFGVLAGACSHRAEPAKDLSALGPPSTRLVGHWATPSNDELYFDAADATYRTGNYVLVHPDKKAFRHKYHIDAEDPSDQHIAVTLLFADGTRGDTKYTIAEDGRSMIESRVVTGIPTETELRRVDDKTTR
jgi:hypothetical protein